MLVKPLSYSPVDLPSWQRAAPAKKRRLSDTNGMSAFETVIGLPTSMDSSRASSAASASMVLRLMIDADASHESPDDTAAQYQWAIAKAPGDRVLRYNFGLFLFDFDRDAAAEQLRMSQPWDGFPVFAPDGTQLE